MGNFLTNADFLAIVDGGAPESTDQHDDLIALDSALPEFAKSFLPPLLAALKSRAVCTFDAPLRPTTKSVPPTEIAVKVNGYTTPETLFLFVGGNYAGMELIISRRHRTLKLEKFEGHIGTCAELLLALVRLVKDDQDATQTRPLPPLLFGQATTRFTGITF